MKQFVRAFHVCVYVKECEEKMMIKVETSGQVAYIKPKKKLKKKK